MNRKTGAWSFGSWLSEQIGENCADIDEIKDAAGITWGEMWALLNDEIDFNDLVVFYNDDGRIEKAIAAGAGCEPIELYQIEQLFNEEK